MGFRQALRPPPIWLLLLALLAVLFLLLPVLVLLWYGAANISALGTVAVIDALLLTFWTTAVTLVITMIFGTPLAFLLARYQFWGKALLDAALDLPLVLPPVVAGLGLLLTFGRTGLLGAPLALAGIELAFSAAAVVMAQIFVAAPYFIRTLRAGIAQLEPDLENAARVDGASEFQVLRFITLPVLRPSLLEGAVLTWTRAVGEFGATILFAGSLMGSTRTLTLAVYGALESDLGAALVLSGFMALLAFAVLYLLRFRNR